MAGSLGPVGEGEELRMQGQIVKGLWLMVIIDGK